MLYHYQYIVDGWEGFIFVDSGALLMRGYDLYLLAIAKLLNSKYSRLLSFYFHTLIQQRHSGSWEIFDLKPQSVLQNSQMLWQMVNHQDLELLETSRKISATNRQKWHWQ
ncbi:MAG: hypothetical protein QNJ68_16695 [Microcoleaceae cyanobacterium MO_207.B10]|nr:hypothetical protein [Microcoleaceae cyanobacterium MO_207.B10]